MFYIFYRTGTGTRYSTVDLPAGGASEQRVYHPSSDAAAQRFGGAAIPQGPPGRPSVRRAPAVGQGVALRAAL